MSRAKPPRAEYQPSAATLEKYAQVLVNFALHSGQGVRAEEVVECYVPDVAKPLALALQKVILQAGAFPIIRLAPTGFDRQFFELANHHQLTFFPEKYYRAKADLIDHQIGIIADTNPEELRDIDPKKIVTARDAKHQYRDWLMEKEVQGAFTWSLGLWGVSAKAKIAGLSLKQYWQQIIKACYLDADDPIAEWRTVQQFQTKLLEAINALSIEKLLVKGPDVDLTIHLGADRIWQGGSGRNIPSFELFTSPDWRGTEGWIKFNQPVYRYGHLLNGVELAFERGRVVKARAAQGQKLLDQMLLAKNADKIGEFSLTDGRTSRITHFMAETLFDENIGGQQGNTHLAIGMAYKDCYRGDAAALSKADWAEKGFNESPEHTDIVSTAQRRVTALLTDGTQKVIYDSGQFVLS